MPALKPAVLVTESLCSGAADTVAFEFDEVAAAAGALDTTELVAAALDIAPLATVAVFVELIVPPLL